MSNCSPTCDVPCEVHVSTHPEEFTKELESLINRHSIENGSDTPDWILAEYLRDCLAAFETTTRRREAWYGRGKTPDPSGLDAAIQRLDTKIADGKGPTPLTQELKARIEARQAEYLKQIQPQLDALEASRRPEQGPSPVINSPEPT